MSKSSCDPNAQPTIAEPVIFADPVFLPDAPPPSPKGRVFYETLGIRIDREGVWHYHGSPIRRKELVCMFAHALTRDEMGRHWLVTPAEMGLIEVEDAAFIAVELFVTGKGAQQTLSLRTNVDEIVTLGDEYRLRLVRQPGSGEMIPYVSLRRRLEARVIRPVYYELAALGVETEIDRRPCIAVWSGGQAFPLGWLDEAA